MAKVAMQTIFESPQILGVILLSQIRKFLRCASSNHKLQISLVVIANPQIFTKGKRR
jgi:hypothetical protein